MNMKKLTGTESVVTRKFLVATERQDLSKEITVQMSRIINSSDSRGKSRFVIATGVVLAMFAGQLEFAGAAQADPTPPAYVVTTCLDTVADDSVLSLREAVAEANLAGLVNQAITFDPTIACNGDADPAANEGHPLVLGSTIEVTANGLTIDGLGQTSGDGAHFINVITRGYSNETSSTDESNWYVDANNSILYQEVYYEGPLFYINGPDTDFAINITGLKIDGNGDNYMGRAIDVAPQAAPGTMLVNVTDSSIVNNRLGSADSCTAVDPNVTPPTIPDFNGSESEHPYSTICVTYVDGDRLHASGAAILAQGAGSSVHITNSNVSDNFAKGVGGAIVADRVEVTNSDINRNTAYSNPNQAIVRGGGAILALNEVTVSGSTFKNNKIVDGYGGAIAVAGKFSISNDSLFQNNAANPATDPASELNHDLAPQSLRVGFGGAVSSNIFAAVNGWTRFDGEHLPTDDALTSDDSNAEIWLTDPDGDMRGGKPFIDPDLLAANDTIDNSTFDSNAATNGDGGAVFGDGNLDITTSDAPTTSFTTNQAPNGNGGAVAVRSALTVSDTRFESNTASGDDVEHGAGGAIHGSGSTSITRSSFLSNISYLDGGAVYTTFTAPLTVSQSQFNSNRSNLNGGAISANDSLTLEKSTFDQNVASNNGGALAVYSFANAINNTFYKNSAGASEATGNGGAVYIWNEGSVAEGATVGNAGSHFVNNTFRGNTALASAGDSIYSAGDTDHIGAKVLIAIANIFAADSDDAGDSARVQCVSTSNNGWSAYTDWQFNIATDNSCGAAAATIGSDPGPASPSYLSTNVVDTVANLVLFPIDLNNSQPTNNGYATTIALGISSSAVNVFFKSEDATYSPNSLPWVQTSETFTPEDRDAFVPTVDQRDTDASAVSRDSNLAGPINTGQIGSPYNTKPQHDVGAYEFTSGVPKAETNEATLVRNTTATLNGVVDPYRLISSDASFYYTKVKPSDSDLANRCTDSLIADWSKATAAQSPVYGYSDRSVSAALTSLSEDTTYYFCVHVTTDAGNKYGFILNFKTLLSTAETNDASPVGDTSATLHGTIKPFRVNPADASFYYTSIEPVSGVIDNRCSDELVATPGLGWTQIAADQSPVTGDNEQTLSVDVTTLTKHTVYWFCVQVGTDVGNKYGYILNFETGPNQAVVQTRPATDVTANSASIHGWITPNARPVGNMRFRYTKVQPVSANEPCVSVDVPADTVEVPALEDGVTPDKSTGKGNDLIYVHADLSGLDTNALYYFCVYFETPALRTPGGTATFITNAAAPDVLTMPATNVDNNKARINGLVNSHAQAVSLLEFYYKKKDVNNPLSLATCNAANPDVKIAASLPGKSIVSLIDGGTAEDAVLMGLLPGVTYEYCIAIATSGYQIDGVDQVVTGDVEEFTTGPAATAETKKATNITLDGGQMNGTVDPQLLDDSSDTVRFRYSLVEPAAGQTCEYMVDFTEADATPATVSGTNPTDVSYTFTGGNAGETYYYCVIMQSPTETVYGDTFKIVLDPSAPIAVTDPSSHVGHDSALLDGTLNPRGRASTSMKFYWSATPLTQETCTTVGTEVQAYVPATTSTNPDPDIARIENTLASTKTNILGNGDVAVSAYLDGVLQPATTYFYCVYLRTGTGANVKESVGNIQEFTTQNLHLNLDLNLAAGGGIKGAVATTGGDGMLPNTDPAVTNCYPDAVGDVLIDGVLSSTPNLDSEYCTPYVAHLYQYSKKKLVGTFSVDENGQFVGEYVIAACPTPGLHKFQIEGTAPDGSIVTKFISFIVDPSCSVPSLTRGPTEETTLQLQDILFPNYKYTLTAKYKKRLRAYAPLLKAAKSLKITGYTETKQPSRSALLACIVLSGNRAKIVRSYLRSLGVKIKYITIARGATNPVSIKNQYRNRRVVLKFTIDLNNAYTP